MDCFSKINKVFTFFNLYKATLIKIFRKVPADLINIIEYNPIDAAKFEKPEQEKVEKFMNHLSKNRVNARLRRSRGKDIDAACGQLANKA